MNIEVRLKEMKNEIARIESDLRKPKELYSWDAIKQTFKIAMPIISDEALTIFREQLKLSNNEPNPPDYPGKIQKKRRVTFERRERVPGTPKAHDMTAPIIDYLITCKNMTASKKDIYEAIKHNYPQNILAIPHRKSGKDVPGVTLVEYRINWAVWVLTTNNKAIGPKKDPSLAEGHIRLVDANKFTDEEINFLKRNGGHLKGFNE